MYASFFPLILKYNSSSLSRGHNNPLKLICEIPCDIYAHYLVTQRMFAVALQVNGVNIEGMKHSEVVAFIKKGGDQTWLLVVDPDTDEHFKKSGLVPTISHVKGGTSLFYQGAC